MIHVINLLYKLRLLYRCYMISLQLAFGRTPKSSCQSPFVSTDPSSTRKKKKHGSESVLGRSSRNIITPIQQLMAGQNPVDCVDSDQTRWFWTRTKNDFRRNCRHIMCIYTYVYVYNGFDPFNSFSSFSFS